MDFKDTTEPKTRTELKKSGKRDSGPYSAKHARLSEQLREKRLAQEPPKK